MTEEEMHRISVASGDAVTQIAKEEGWDLNKLKAAWVYCKPFQQMVKDYINACPPELMRVGMVLMIEALKAALVGTTQVMFEEKAGDFDEEQGNAR